MKKGTSSKLLFLISYDILPFKWNSALFPLQVWRMLSASPLKSWQCLCTSSLLASSQVSSACLYASVKTSASFNSINWQSCFKSCQSWSCRLHSSAQSLITQLITETAALWLLGDSESPFSSLTIALGKVTGQMQDVVRVQLNYYFLNDLLMDCFCNTIAKWFSQMTHSKFILIHMWTLLK